MSLFQPTSRRAPRRHTVAVVLAAIVVALGLLAAVMGAPRPAEAAQTTVSWKAYSDGVEATVYNGGKTTVTAGVSFIGNSSKKARPVPGVAPVKLKPGQTHVFSVYLPASDSSGIFWATFNGKPLGKSRAYKYGNRKAPTSPRVGYGTKQVVFANANKYKAKVVYRVNGGAKHTAKLAKGQVVVLGLPTGAKVTTKRYVWEDGHWKKVGSDTVRTR